MCVFEVSHHIPHKRALTLLLTHIYTLATSQASLPRDCPAASTSVKRLNHFQSVSAARLAEAPCLCYSLKLHTHTHTHTHTESIMCTPPQDTNTHTHKTNTHTLENAHNLSNSHITLLLHSPFILPTWLLSSRSLFPSPLLLLSSPPPLLPCATPCQQSSSFVITYSRWAHLYFICWMSSYTESTFCWYGLFILFHMTGEIVCNMVVNKWALFYSLALSRFISVFLCLSVLSVSFIFMRPEVGANRTKAVKNVSGSHFTPTIQL